jgi:hypothetical protein
MLKAVLLQRHAELIQPPVNPSSDRAQGDLEDLGDLPEAEMFKIAELKDFLRQGIEVLEGVAEKTLPLFPDGDVRGCGALVRQSAQQAGFFFAPAGTRQVA